MLRVPIEQAQPGMVLARSVANPQNPRHTLLKTGCELDEDFVQRLKELRVYSIWVSYPNLDFLDEIIDPEVTRQQQELYSALKEQFSNSQEMSLAKVNYGDYIVQVRYSVYEQTFVSEEFSLVIR